MNLRIRIFLPAGLVALGLLLAGIYFTRPVTLWVDGVPLQTRGPLLTVADALRQAEVGVGPDDWLSPPANQLLPASGVVVLERARPVSIWANGLPLTFITPERIPASLLARVNLRLFPGDRLLSNGKPVDALQPLPRADRLYLQYSPARALVITENGANSRVYSAAETLGEGLWAAGWPLRSGDRVKPALDTPLSGDQQVEIVRAKRLNIQVEGRQVVIRTAAARVGEALAEAGLSLQGLDFSLPTESDPLPADGNIRVVRAREELVFNQTTVGFKSSYSADPNLELDQRSVLTPGKLGIKVSRERVRLEDGQEVSRQTESEWVATEPQDQVLGYGTQIVVKSMDTPDGSIEYYRAVNMYATSYSPCQQGLGRCSLSTSSGTLLKKGVVAVTLTWYRMFRGAQVYIPGYGVGTIADVGGGIPGVYWIDLGYSEEDYEGWSQTVTVYFLTPAPSSAPPILP